MRPPEGRALGGRGTYGEHPFVGDTGSPYALFQRSIDRRNLVSATSAAYALPELSLADAAALVLLAAEKDPDRRDVPQGSRTLGRERRSTLGRWDSGRVGGARASLSFAKCKTAPLMGFRLG
jgi:hypothetical protein